MNFYLKLESGFRQTQGGVYSIYNKRTDALIFSGHNSEVISFLTLNDPKHPALPLLEEEGRVETSQLSFNFSDEPISFNLNHQDDFIIRDSYDYYNYSSIENDLGDYRVAELGYSSSDTPPPIEEEEWDGLLNED